MVENTKQTTVVHFIADGDVSEFHFNFQIFEAGDVDVYLDETLTDTGYNVSVDEEIGGKVIFNQPPANGTRITIIRNLDIKRTSDFQEGGAFRAKVINHELDYQVATLQQLDEKIGRSMIYPPYAQEGVSTSLPLPSAGKALVWNQQATALINSSINVDNTIAEVTSLQQQAQKAAEQASQSAAQTSDDVKTAAEYVGSIAGALEQATQSASDAAESAERAEQYAVNSSFGNLGDIQYTSRVDVPNGGVRCDGTEYTQVLFPEIYQMLVDGKLQKTDYASFASKVSSAGYCEMFAIDTGSQKFKVPFLPDMYVNTSKTVCKPYVMLHSAATEISTIQAQEFLSAIAEKANKDLSNIATNINYVVATGVNYLKFKSGIQICWGTVSGTSTTFPKPFKDNNYSVSFVITSQNSTYAYMSMVYYINSKTATGFSRAETSQSGNYSGYYIAIGQGV